MTGRGRENFFKANGWNWGFKSNGLPEPKPKTHFIYGFISLSRPVVRVER